MESKPFPSSGSGHCHEGPLGVDGRGGVTARGWGSPCLSRTPSSAALFTNFVGGLGHPPTLDPSTSDARPGAPPRVAHSQTSARLTGEQWRRERKRALPPSTRILGFGAAGNKRPFMRGHLKSHREARVRTVTHGVGRPRERLGFSTSPHPLRVHLPIITIPTRVESP